MAACLQQPQTLIAHGFLFSTSDNHEVVNVGQLSTDSLASFEAKHPLPPSVSNEHKTRPNEWCMQQQMGGLFKPGWKCWYCAAVCRDAWLSPTYLCLKPSGSINSVYLKPHKLRLPTLLSRQNLLYLELPKYLF